MTALISPAKMVVDLDRHTEVFEEAATEWIT